MEDILYSGTFDALLFGRHGRKMRMRLQVLTIRIVLGLIFGILLTRVFFPDSGTEIILLICGLLIFFSYVFEYMRKKGNG